MIFYHNGKEGNEDNTGFRWQENYLGEGGVRRAQREQRVKSMIGWNHLPGNI